MTGAARALVVSGGDGWSDPWHPFERTSAALAEILEAAGVRVELSIGAPGRLADLEGVDLLAVNAPAPGAPLDEGLAAAVADSVRRHLRAGGAVLAVHVGVTTLLGVADWSSVVGARWIPGRSGHPPLGRAAVSRRADPRTGPAGTFELLDERYSDLVLAEELTVVVEHEHDGRTHPLVWTREAGRGRVVADALGHGPESFESAEHRAVLTRLVGWALEPRGYQNTPVENSEARNVSASVRKVAAPRGRG